MVAFIALTLALLLPASALAGTTVWSGSFDTYPTAADFDTCEI